MENKRILIDTSVLIDHFRKKNKKSSYLYKLSKNNDLYLSAITKFEILIGTKEHQINDIKKLIECFSILKYNSKSVEVSANILKDLRSKNQLIDFRDIFIASTAISNNLILATLNIKHFERISNLQCVSFVD